MSTEELEVAALRLAPQERARLAQRLLESLENLSDDENARLWLEEAERRDQAWDLDPTMGRPANDVFRDASARLK
jgi:Putative addiction module component